MDNYLKNEIYFNGRKLTITYVLEKVEEGMCIHCVLLENEKTVHAFIKTVKNLSEFSDVTDEVLDLFYTDICDEMDEYYFGKEE